MISIFSLSFTLASNIRLWQYIIFMYDRKTPKLALYVRISYFIDFLIVCGLSLYFSFWPLVIAIIGYLCIQTYKTVYIPMMRRMIYYRLIPELSIVIVTHVARILCVDTYSILLLQTILFVSILSFSYVCSPQRVNKTNTS